jgi:hypothetical protein
MVLPVRSTRLCPDCDILTESLLCPVCGRDRTFPVAVWLHPLGTTRPAARSTLALRRRLSRRRSPGLHRVPGRVGPSRAS